MFLPYDTAASAWSPPWRSNSDCPRRSAEVLSLDAREPSIGHDGTEIVHRLVRELPTAKITAILGPHASGHSTLLGTGPAAAAASGMVGLDGADIHQRPTKRVATKVGIRPQPPQALDGSLGFLDLVRKGQPAGWER